MHTQIKRACSLIMVVLLSLFLFNGLLWAAQATAEKKTAITEDKKTGSTELQPKAFFPEPRWEFQPILEGVDITHDFIIENRGQTELLIQNVRPD